MIKYKFIPKNPDHLEGKVTVFADIYNYQQKKVKTFGSFATTDFEDIVELFYADRNKKELLVNSKLRFPEGIRLPKDSESLRFYSIDLPVISDGFFQTIKGDFHEIGKSPSEKEAYYSIGIGIADYIGAYVKQHFTYATEFNNLFYVFKIPPLEPSSHPVNVKTMTITPTNILIPGDDNNYNDYYDKLYLLKPIIMNGYIRPLKFAINNCNNKVTNELISSFRSFMKGSSDFQGDIDTIINHILIKSNVRDQIIKLILSKWISTITDNMEVAAEYRDKIKELDKSM